MKVFIDLLWYFKKEKKSYVTGIFLLSLVSLLELIPPLVIGLIIDQIEQKILTMNELLKWSFVLCGAGILVYLFRFWWRIMIFGSALKLDRLLRNELYEHFTKMSTAFYQKKRIGDLMAHATNDLQAIQQTAGIGVLTLVDSITTGGFVLIAMAVFIDWKLTLISLIPMPVMAFATSRYGSILHKRFHKAQEAFSNLNDKVQENINGMRVIKAFGYEKEEIESFRLESKDVVNKNIQVAKVDALFDPTISLIVGFSYFLAVSFGAMFVVNEQLTIGQLVAFTTYLGLLIWPMLAFGWLFNIVERGRASYDRVSLLLKEKVDITSPSGEKVKEGNGNIEYAINQFTYPGASSPALEKIHFNIKEGETVGIVGKTGSGKSTIVRLLLREYDMKDGYIKLGDHKITSYDIQDLRSKIGYVPQEHFLFTSTIAENISFAKPEATFHEISKSAEVANIHRDIMRFSDGYETVVGERGVTLSGGQKQRISIARAIILNPSILILDDSLSAVDAKTEEHILQALGENRKGKTTFITAHRLSAIMHADHILVLDKGNVIESGTHSELMKKEGWYYDTYQRQQLEALIEHGG